MVKLHHANPPPHEFHHEIFQRNLCYKRNYDHSSDGYFGSNSQVFKYYCLFYRPRLSWNFRPESLVESRTLIEICLLIEVLLLFITQMFRSEEVGLIQTDHYEVLVISRRDFERLIELQ